MLNNVCFSFLLCLSLFACTTKNSASQPVASTAPSVGVDPLYQFQWHLKNSGQLGGVSGIDVNAEGAHDSNILGNNVVVMAVDDGAELSHEDLKANANTALSINYLSNGLANNDPGGSAATHGTCVSGLMAARNDNAVGGMGVAPHAQVAARNIIAKSNSTNVEIADALSSSAAAIYVSNNSWGPADGIGQFVASDSTIHSAIQTGLRTGRNGLGIAYFWAAGNGYAYSIDNSNYDGYANYYGVTAIGAVGDDGTRAYYSEPGANVWVVTPSQGATGAAITTTDQSGESGYNSSADATDYSNKNYTKFFNGTSAASPIAAGVAALIMEANPSLSWRDIRIILARTAKKIDITNTDWAQNAATTVSGGYHINHNYGFGLVDATAAVQLAPNFTSVGVDSQMLVVNEPTSGAQNVSLAIPDNNSTGVSNTITVASSGITNIEYVTITANINHSNWGNLDITLTRSGSSTTSATLAVNHTCYTTYPSTPSPCTLTGNTWTFGAARFLDEAADGNWTLTVKDRVTGTTGTFTSWQLTFYGR